MNHLDLFSGIGGFAIAVDEVFGKSEHIFCEIDSYCQALLKKRFPGSKIYGDIRTLSSERLTADTELKRPIQCEHEERTRHEEGVLEGYSGVDILTGGFPCQPFSQAGKRKGTDDNRYLWPEMLRVIRDFKPTWVIAENVRGLLTIEQGMVFEQVCLDLENEGYEVQPFVIPAVAKNAPHRRDRVWFIANRNIRASRSGNESKSRAKAHEKPLPNNTNNNASNSNARWVQRYERESLEEGAVTRSSKQCNAPDTANDGPHSPQDTEGNRKRDDRNTAGKNKLCEPKRSDTLRAKTTGWNQNWLEVATELCGVDDGLPAELHGLKLSKARHRVERLKALGNAIVPQVAIEIMKAIKNTR
jgi:DNA (cytosine-5)-methyltransferase 1